MFDAGKTRMIGLPYGEKKLWPYVKPFLSDTGTLRTDGQICYINIARRYADALSRVSMLTRDKIIIIVSLHTGRFVVVHLYSTFSVDARISP